MQDMNMGFNKENVISLNNGWSVGQKKEEFKHELSRHPEFGIASFASGLPPNIQDGNLFRKAGTEQDIVLGLITVDYDHLKTMGYTMAGGRFFAVDFPSDSNAIILNETAYKQLGFHQIEGNTVINFNAESPVPFNLIGVVRDFNFENLRSSIKPMAMLLSTRRNNMMVRQGEHSIAIRIMPGDASKALSKLEGIWKKYSSLPYEFAFLDENIDAMFRSEQRMGQIVLIFTVLTISIASLGLFGLATYLGEQRSKEISIRKVLGASVMQVMTLLLKDFAILIAIAFIIASPIGWYFMNNWLQEFAYRIDVEFWMIFVAGLISLAIAILTITFQSIKVARENPVKMLKSE
jgi:putative ABC transport system permease protein